MTTRILRFLLMLAILKAALSSAQIVNSRAPKLSRHSQEQISVGFGKLPMRFEENHGQFSGETRFISRGPGYSASLTAGGMVLGLKPTAIAEPHVTNKPIAKGARRQQTTLKFNLLGAAREPLVVGESQLPGRVNYFFGNDPRRWRTNVPIYARVRYKGIYPGIDLVYYGNSQDLEYDFEIAAGADPNLIRFEIRGANQLEIDANGDLVLATSEGQLHFQSPVVYQNKGGQRIAVRGGYVLDDPRHVSFHVAQYDVSRPLVIDPVLVYSTYFGGNA